MSTPFYTLALASTTVLTPSACLLRFAIPQELKATFQFTPGQHVSIRPALPNSEPISRPYSICELDDDFLTVVVKRVPNGIVSNFINDHFQAGRQVEMTAPKGKYTFVAQTPRSSLLLFATGSGITPIYSIIRAALLQDAAAKITLFYGNSTAEETIFYKELQALSAAHPTFKIHFFFSQEAEKRRIDQNNLSVLHQNGEIVLDKTAEILVYLCGVPAMMDNVKSFLLAKGVQENRIFHESFIKNNPPKTTSAPSTSPTKSHITVIIDKTKTEFMLDDQGESILEAANALGADLPHSCLGGICCSCRAKLLEGKVEMRENLALDVEEEKAGYILCCQARPKSEKVVISFDI